MLWSGWIARRECQQIATALALSIAIGACGGTESVSEPRRDAVRVRGSTASGGRAAYPSRDRQILARGSVVGVGTFRISGERYEYDGVEYFSLKGTVFTGVSGEKGGETASTSVTAHEPGVIAPLMQTGCIGSKAYTLLFALLRAPSDTVIAEGAGRTVMLRDANIPSVLRAGGVLVYRPLTWMPRDVTVRDHDGRLVADENFDLPPGRCGKT